MGTVSRYDARGRDHRPKSITCICRRGSIKTELFRLEDHLLYIPRQDISAHIPMRLDVYAVGTPNRGAHRVCNKLPNSPTTVTPAPVTDVQMDAASSWSSMTIGLARCRKAATSWDLRETRTGNGGGGLLDGTAST